jgi:hypothetical protein
MTTTTRWLAAAYVKARFGGAELAWLDRTCRHVFYVAVPVSSLSGIATFGFKHEEDAIAFKIRFGL